MNQLHYQAIKKGVAVWNRYALACRYCDPAWRADLRYADLRNADLRQADLWDADLREADLRYTYLWGADLRYANLAGTNLRDANLRQANLRYADLSDSMRVNYDTKYKIIVLPDYTCIGCQRKPSEGWISATEDDVAGMADDARDWWRKYGEMVKDIIREVI